MNADGSDLTRLTEPGEYGNPEWSLDGSHIAFESSLDGADIVHKNRGIFVVNVDRKTTTLLFEAGVKRGPSGGLAT